MPTLDALRQLYDYNYWARDEQLACCSTLTPEQFLRPMGSSFSSVRDTLAHLLAVEWVWLERFKGRSPRAIPAWLDELKTPESIGGRWKEVERDMRAYLGVLNADMLAGPLSYVNIKGEPWTYPLEKPLFHLVNHQTYHRGQVTTLLRQLGAKAVPLDFLVYCDQRK